MGWAEDARKRADKSILLPKEASDAPAPPSIEPRPVSTALGPSEFLEGILRAFVADANNGANEIAAVLSPPSILTPRPKLDPMVAGILASQVRTLRLLCGIADVLLVYTTGRPELRPMPKP